MSRLTYTLAVIGLVVTTACSGNDSSTKPAAAVDSSSQPSEATQPSPTLPTPVVQPGGPISKRCGEPDAPARWIRLRGPDRDRLAAVVVGKGPVTAVFSHQTNPQALCGFWPFAVWLAREHGIRSILVDHCGSGASACAYDDFYDDRAGQLKPAIEWAREHGAERVSLVGASLGGTTAIVAAARFGPSVDAAVDLSGPLRSIGLNGLGSAPRVTVPTLLVLARYDGVATMGEYKRLFDALGSSTKRFLRVETGHGWETLGWQWKGRFTPTPVAKTVAAWLRGDFAGR